MMAHKTKFFGLLIFPLVLVTGTWLSLGQLDRNGQQFYAQGKEVVQTLDRLAAALHNRDLAAVEGLYSPSFHGAPLGLVSPRRAEEKDGIAVLRFAAGAGDLDRGAALDEWRGYLAGLDAIDEV